MSSIYLGIIGVLLIIAFVVFYRPGRAMPPVALTEAGKANATRNIEAGAMTPSTVTTTTIQTTTTRTGEKPTVIDLLPFQVAILQDLTSDNEVILQMDRSAALSFTGWQQNARVLSNYTNFIENVARSYTVQLAVGQRDLRQKKRTRIEEYINALDTRLAPAGNPIKDAPWGGSKTPFTILIPRALCSYLIMVTDGDMDTRKKALLLLERLITKPEMALQVPFKRHLSIYTTVPYLIMLHMKSANEYRSQINDIKTLDAYDFMNPIVYDHSNLRADSWYRDLTYVINDLEFSYTPLVSCAGFYSNLWVAFGLPFGGLSIFREALEKLLHPRLKQSPIYAFWGYDGIRDTKYFGATPKTGLFVYPAVGVGVYKTNDVYFHLRVQKANQTVIPLKVTKSIRDLFLAVQSRKIYTTANIESDKGTFLHPNTISTIELSPDKTLPSSKSVLLAQDPEQCYSTIGVIDGCLIWLNRYYIIDLVDAEVYEIGVFSEYGCYQYYEVANRASVDLRFQTIPDSADIKYSISETKNNDGIVVIPKGVTKKFYTHQKLLQSFDHKLNHIEIGKFSFRTPSKEYTLAYSKGNAVITTNTSSFLFTEHPQVQHTVVVSGNTYKRNPKTLTYEIHTETS